jgi:hypothetical protein
MHAFSNGQGRFAEKDAAELDTLDAGSWFSSDFAGAHIPRLIDVLKTCRDIDIGINLEVCVCTCVLCATMRTDLCLLTLSSTD